MLPGAVGIPCAATRCRAAAARRVERVDRLRRRRARNRSSRAASVSISGGDHAAASAPGCARSAARAGSPAGGTLRVPAYSMSTTDRSASSGRRVMRSGISGLSDSRSSPRCSFRVAGYAQAPTSCAKRVKIDVAAGHDRDDLAVSASGHLQERARRRPRSRRAFRDHVRALGDAAPSPAPPRRARPRSSRPRVAQERPHRRRAPTVPPAPSTNDAVQP